MQIFNSAEDMRVMLSTPAGRVLDLRVTELELLDQGPGAPLRAGEMPLLTALLPGRLLLRKRDGSEICVLVGWGSLTMVGKQARVVVSRAEPSHRASLQVAG